jgi:uncharacterized protein YjbJ (UPF0337 family)
MNHWVDELETISRYGYVAQIMVSIMSLKDRAKATGKDMEGKIQETVGNVTNDPKDKAEGKAKQAEAKVRNKVEDAKDEVKKAID